MHVAVCFLGGHFDLEAEQSHDRLWTLGLVDTTDVEIKVPLVRNPELS